MNRKLHNTLLAASTTGLALVVGLLLASPVTGPGPRGNAGMGAQATAARDAHAGARLARTNPGRVLVAIEAASGATAPAHVDGLSGVPAQSAVSLLAEIATDAAIEAAMASLDANADAACAVEADSVERRARRNRAVDAFATPYFSFAHGMRDGTGA
jgi:hypothetical protein